MTGGGDAVARDCARGQGPGDRPGSGGRVPAGAPGNAAAGRPALRSPPVARLARDSLAVITTHRGPTHDGELFAQHELYGAQVLIFKLFS